MNAAQYNEELRKLADKGDWEGLSRLADEAAATTKVRSARARRTLSGYKSLKKVSEQIGEEKQVGETNKYGFSKTDLRSGDQQGQIKTRKRKPNKRKSNKLKSKRMRGGAEKTKINKREKQEKRAREKREKRAKKKHAKDEKAREKREKRAKEKRAREEQARGKQAKEKQAKEEQAKEEQVREKQEQSREEQEEESIDEHALWPGTFDEADARTFDAAIEGYAGFMDEVQPDEFPGLGNPLPDFDPQSPCLSNNKDDILAVDDNIQRVEDSRSAPGILNTKHNKGEMFTIKEVNEDRLSVKGADQLGWHPCINYDKIGSE